MYGVSENMIYHFDTFHIKSILPLRRVDSNFAVSTKTFMLVHNLPIAYKTYLCFLHSYSVATVYENILFETHSFHIMLKERNLLIVFFKNNINRLYIKERQTKTNK